MSQRNAVINASSLWPNGIVPYLMSTTYNKREKDIIQKAIDVYHNRTCVRFVPKTLFQFDYIFIYNGYACASEVGHKGGAQHVLLGETNLHQIREPGALRIIH